MKANNLGSIFLLILSAIASIFRKCSSRFFLEASNKFTDRPAGQVAWASVDADRNPAIASKFHVNKYPTLKLFRNGEVVKKEYRSTRSVEGLAEFIQKQLESTIKYFSNPNDFAAAINPDRRTILSYFKEQSGVEFDNLKKVASLMREDCDFLVGIGENNFPNELQTADPKPKLTFKPSKSDNQQLPLPYGGDLQNFEDLKKFASDVCVPLVREITFNNAEELTEEGLPFLILFKHPDDTATEKNLH
ncbi:unnamed protein product [Caenorhabditis auriculariae]|uniref:Thioredoxin domain-containing protein n=1 Tax=Caenorhabditis auriculariae TaxID=2777116 RepID=A0A8S1HXR0_9PELO|nr:unnamed protein product [Caenorhabditis auriculariae]